MQAEELLNVLRPLWAGVLPGPEREPVYPFGERPLTEYLRQWATREPQRAAIVYYGAVTTYAYDAASRLTRLARGSATVDMEYDAGGRRQVLALIGQRRARHPGDSQQCEALTGIGANAIARRDRHWEASGVARR